MVAAAMDRSGGNASAAGRLIGESPYQMFCLLRYHKGESPRPSRSTGASPEKSVRKRARRAPDA